MACAARATVKHSIMRGRKVGYSSAWVWKEAMPIMFKPFIEEYQQRMYPILTELGFTKPTFYHSVLAAEIIYPHQGFALIIGYDVRDKYIECDFFRAERELLERLGWDEYGKTLQDGTRLPLEQVLSGLGLLALLPYKERVRKKLYASLSPDPEVGDLYRNLDEAFQRFHKALRGLPPPDYYPFELIKAQASLHQRIFQKYGSLIVGYVKHRFGVSS